ncbi:ATP-binding protein [Flavobacterium sp. N502540]|uniref:ATP-binding protein n=1 Tax=Flavobacterium sp. N502540 TaxID=2986838 RepID=UPI0022248DDE|nr:ATP-binding protein [Flavobacterium sp. N502540]
MNDFKLIAIIPLSGCNSAFSKSLTLGTPFQFYQHYDILTEANEKITNVTAIEKLHSVKDLYKLSNGIKLNISAVAGKNGSGKSTIFELFYYAIYLTATRPSEGEEPLLNKAFGYLQYQKNTAEQHRRSLIHAAKLPGFEKLDAEKTKKIDNLEVYIFEIIRENELKINASRFSSLPQIYEHVSAQLQNRISDLDFEIEQEKAKESLLDESFNVSVLYETGGEIRELLCRGGEVEHSRFDQKLDGAKFPLENFSLNDFFYTISLNYSHHSLNSKNLGHWINKLFHKNDGYRTPVVINPMRHEGNFNINDELKLSRERLLSNLAYNLINSDDNLLLDRYKVTRFIFTPKLGPGLKDIDQLTLRVAKERSGLNLRQAKGAYSDVAFEYLNKKISKISDSYGFLKDNGEEDWIFERNIFTDKSHIMRKIDGTLNYLKFVNTDSHNKIWGNGNAYGPISVASEKFKRYLQLFGKEAEQAKPEDIIKFALPGFFNIDFEFVDTKNKSTKIKLSDMSSGEQQSIFNINTILYHLYNIQSIHPKDKDVKKKGASSKRAAYSNVNIVLDEVELYYHPQMQRALVKSMVSSLENLKGSSGIKSINICILTHSPFILSDIPACNVLLLERGKKGNSVVKPSTGESFAANINDLLADSFFLEDTLMGDFASQEITSLIERIDSGNSAEQDDYFIEMIGDPYLKTSLRTFKKSHDKDSN